MIVKATKIKAKDLKAGDLFSPLSPAYWKHHNIKGSIGERVYIRTEEPCPVDQEGEETYKITIEV